jgi:hypothetical protein
MCVHLIHFRNLKLLSYFTIRCTPGEIHAHKSYAHAIHAQKIHAHEMHAMRNIPLRYIFIRTMPIKYTLRKGTPIKDMPIRYI